VRHVRARHANGVKRLVAFVKSIVDEMGSTSASTGTDTAIAAWADERARRARSRRDARARHGARHRRTHGQRRDGPVAREPAPAGLDRQRPVEARTLRRAREQRRPASASTTTTRCSARTRSRPRPACTRRR
jgi:hypothetical protein